MKANLFAHPFVSRSNQRSDQSLQKRVQADTQAAGQWHIALTAP